MKRRKLVMLSVALWLQAAGLAADQLRDFKRAHPHAPDLVHADHFGQRAFLRGSPATG